MKIAAVSSFGNNLFKKSLFKRSESISFSGTLKSSPLKELRDDVFEMRAKN